ncbi:hypothetical protein AS850_00370 [Frondihabitans sp. 762G35]|nr:hypothetical protein AS850_00370 [Frondihabitans sp. 762G35]
MTIQGACHPPAGGIKSAAAASSKRLQAPRDQRHNGYDDDQGDDDIEVSEHGYMVCHCGVLVGTDVSWRRVLETWWHQLLAEQKPSHRPLVGRIGMRAPRERRTTASSRPGSVGELSWCRAGMAGRMHAPSGETGSAPRSPEREALGPTSQVMEGSRSGREFAGRWSTVPSKRGGANAPTANAGGCGETPRLGRFRGSERRVVESRGAGGRRHRMTDNRATRHTSHRNVKRPDRAVSIRKRLILSSTR